MFVIETRGKLFTCNSRAGPGSGKLASLPEPWSASYGARALCSRARPALRPPACPGLAASPYPVGRSQSGRLLLCFSWSFLARADGESSPFPCVSPRTQGSWPETFVPLGRPSSVEVTAPRLPRTPEQHCCPEGGQGWGPGCACFSSKEPEPGSQIIEPGGERGEEGGCVPCGLAQGHSFSPWPLGPRVFCKWSYALFLSSSEMSQEYSSLLC